LGTGENTLALSNSAEFVREIQQFRDECQKAPAPPRQRTLRGVVRNGAVHPIESGVLAEGELATITAV